MSPHLIIILTISSCTLLILLLFAVRKRSHKKAEPTSLVNSSASFPDLSSLDLSSLEDISPKIHPQNEIVELIQRYRFFQGKNFERFQEFVQQKNWQKIERLVAEKFQAQGKINPQQMAQEVTQKLLSLQHS